MIEQLKVKGKVSRGWLGVQIQEVTPAIAKSVGLSKDHGALVADVTEGSPARKSGFQQGDVIMSFGSQEITKLRDLTRAVAETPIGQAVKVKVWRNGRESTLEVTIAEQPENMEVAAPAQEKQSPTPQHASALGLRLSPLTADLRKQLKVPAQIKGAVILEISDSSPFADLDLQVGDVIVSINLQPDLTQGRSS